MPQLFLSHPLYISDARPAEAGLRSPSRKEISLATELVSSPYERDRGAGARATAGSRSRSST